MERRERRERRRRIYWERVDLYRLEVYTTRPTIMFRDIATGRFVKAPPYFFVKAVMGAETGGGKEPIEVEVIASKKIMIDELRKLDPFKVREYLDDIEKELYDEARDYVTRRFGSYIGGMLEERGRELTLEILPHIMVRYRHPKHSPEWKVIVVE